MADAGELLEALPECPKCRGPCVTSWRHPRIGSENARARELACLACDTTFRAPALACHSVDDEIAEVHEPEMVALGEAWKRRCAEDQAKFRRAMEGRW